MAVTLAVLKKLSIFVPSWNNLCISDCNRVIRNMSSIFNTRNLMKYDYTFYRHLHFTLPRNASQFKHRDRRDLLRTVAKTDEGLQEEKLVSLNASISSKEDMFVDEKTPHLLFSGIPFNQVPICNIKVTKNNTKVTITDYKNKMIARSTAGVQGFKKCRKGTNVAGQATGMSVSSKAVKVGIKDVRLKIQGLGPGRMAAIKGVEMGGLNIISVTDDTRISFRPKARPRKIRRL